MLVFVGLAEMSVLNLKAGCCRFVVVLDDEDRENEGDLIIPADRMTPEVRDSTTSSVVLRARLQLWGWG